MFVKNIKWDITKQCFLNCSFCLNREERRDEKYVDISFDKIVKIIDGLKKEDIRHIQLLGGEPTYRKDFFKILEYINTTSHIKIGINTNGVLLNNANVDKLLQFKCIDSIVISIDGIKDTHNKMRGSVIFYRPLEIPSAKMI